MMSLTETSLWDAVKKQYVFKLQSYANFFVSQVIVQLVALLFRRRHGGNKRHRLNNILVEVNYIREQAYLFLQSCTANSVILTPFYRNIDFSFVGSRLSGNMAVSVFWLPPALWRDYSTLVRFC